MSGLPSGLRVTLWKIAPVAPSAIPISAPVSARGSRSVSITKLVARSPPPNRVATTSPGGIAISPVPTDHTSSANSTRRQRQPDPDAARRDGHSCAIRRRRTIAMNTGAPISALTIPTSSSPGRLTTRPTTSAPSSITGASSAE